MRCPKCSPAGTAHSVQLTQEVPAAIGAARVFWDEQDREHVHDARWAVRYCECSHGHAFSVGGEAVPCPVADCDFAARRQPQIDRDFAVIQQRG